MNDQSERREREPVVDLEYLRGLISAIDGSSVDSLEISRGGTKIRISKTPAQGVTFPGFAPHAAPIERPHAPPTVVHAPAASPVAAPETNAPAQVASNLSEVKSPMVGTFYRSASPDAPAYVEVGTRVARGQTLCILEAMKLMNELQSEVAGTVREVCVENGEPVEYGQVLFRIAPEA